jgi:hypothetical protein
MICALRVKECRPGKSKSEIISTKLRGRNAMAHPTHEDGQLLVQLARLNAQSGCSEASNFIWSDAFVSDYDEFKRKFPKGSREFGYIGTLAGFYETVGTLVKNELLNEDLVHDWLAVHMVWQRLEGVLIGMRDEAGEPRLWENFQALALRIPMHA